MGRDRDPDPPRRSPVKRLLALLALAFVVTLGVVIGTRLNSEAIAVLMGVGAGVAASIPTALLIMAVTRRRDDDEGEYVEPYDEPRRAVPPVIVVTPGASAQPQLPYQASYPYQQMPTPGQRRQFRVMGYDEEEEEPAEEEAAPWSW
jgi:hypothetical protein